MQEDDEDEPGTVFSSEVVDAGTEVETPSISSVPTARCIRFSPDTVDRKLCMARIWRPVGACARQCDSRPKGGALFCEVHLRGQIGSEAWRTYGHVRGRVPEDRLLEMEHAAASTGSVDEQRSLKRRRLLCRDDLRAFDLGGLVKFTQNSGYVSSKWDNFRDRLRDGEMKRTDFMGRLLLEQDNTLWAEVVRLRVLDGRRRSSDAVAPARGATRPTLPLGS